MTLPKWMDDYPGAPVPGQPDDDSHDEPVGITPCRPCGGEGCGRCDDTGVIYP